MNNANIFFDKLALFICYLFKNYKNHVKKRVRDKTKIIFKKTKKNQNKGYKCAKNRIKQTNAPGYFECACLR